MKLPWFRIIILGCFVLLLWACGQAGVPDLTDETQSPPAAPTQWDDMPKDPPLTIPKSPGPPALIESAKADLAQRLSIPASQIKVIGTKEATWPDASLGCPQPGIVYAQIPTPGYLVILEVARNEYEYHVGIHGNVLYCENPTPPN
jgi:hypothetical protein